MSSNATAPLPCLLPSLVNTPACKLVTTQRSQEEPPFWLNDSQNTETNDNSSNTKPAGAQGGLLEKNKIVVAKQPSEDDCWNSPPEQVASNDIPDTLAPLGSSERLESESEEIDDDEDDDDETEEETDDENEENEGNDSLTSSSDDEEIVVVDLTGSQDELETSLPEVEYQSPSHSQSTPPLSQSPPLSQASPPPVVKQPVAVGSPFCFSVHSSPSPGVDADCSESTSRIAQMRAALRQPITASPFTSPTPSPRPASPSQKAASPCVDSKTSNYKEPKNLLSSPPSEAVIKERNQRSKTPSPSPYLLSLSAGESRIEALRRALNEPLPKKDSPFLQRASPSA